MTSANKGATNSNGISCRPNTKIRTKLKPVPGIPWRNTEAGVGLEEADPVERHIDSKIGKANHSRARQQILGTAARSNRMSACLRASILTFF
jgi:hypothetical protein